MSAKSGLDRWRRSITLKSRRSGSRPCRGIGTGTCRRAKFQKQRGRLKARIGIFVFLGDIDRPRDLLLRQIDHGVLELADLVAIVSLFISVVTV